MTQRARYGKLHSGKSTAPAGTCYYSLFWVLLLVVTHGQPRKSESMLFLGACFARSGKNASKSKPHLILVFFVLTQVHSLIRSIVLYRYLVR